MSWHISSPETWKHFDNPSPYQRAPIVISDIKARVLYQGSVTFMPPGTFLLEADSLYPELTYNHKLTVRTVIPQQIVGRLPDLRALMDLYQEGITTYLGEHNLSICQPWELIPQ
jgi:hypothetical protein